MTTFSLASIFFADEQLKLYPFYTLWGIAFSCVIDYSYAYGA